MGATVKDLFIQLYDLSTPELEILFMLIRRQDAASGDDYDYYEQQSMTLEQISKAMDRDKSTTFRSLQKLVTIGLVVKETRTIKDGGYFHVYSAVDRDTFKKETERKVKELQKSLDRLLKKFESDMQEAISSMYTR
jgi:predicted transcriptional regulator